MCKIMKEQGLKLSLLTPSPCPWHYFSRTLILRRERVKKISQWISKYLIVVAQTQGFSCSWLHSHYWDPSYCYFCLLWPSLWSGFSLNLGLEFWPCCLTSWKACFPLSVPASPTWGNSSTRERWAVSPGVSVLTLAWAQPHSHPARLQALSSGSQVSTECAQHRDRPSSTLVPSDPHASLVSLWFLPVVA